MAWTDGYLQGDFRGVPFFLKGHTFESGRRTAQHEFPGRDGAFNEDNGRKNRAFKLSLYVVGDDYFDQRERLITALEKPGPGRLVHPYRGVYSVVVSSFTQSEDVENGRIAFIDVQFEEDIKQPLTQISINTAKKLYTANSELVNVLQSNLVARYPAGFGLMLAMKAAETAVRSATGAIDSARSVVASVAEYRREMERIQGKITEFTLDAELLGKQISSLAGWGMDLFGVNPPTPETARRMFDEITGLVSALQQPTTTPADDTPGANTANLINDFTISAAAASAAGIVAGIDFETVDDAEEIRGTVFSMLDGIMNSPYVTDDIFNSCADTMTAVTMDLDRRIIGLPNVVEFTATEREPVFTISQDFYGNIDKVDELINRNGVAHPGFFKALTPIKVQV